ncbi:hypothetical protein MHU86_6235 [Fragilaria crotonensis]|nr:hypothetical protein MHU86_6235 [Fragilaria crotonensis]
MKVQSQFIFGYGSLICSHSRAVTSPEHAHSFVTPVAVKGVERVWSKRSHRMTAMGIRFNSSALTMGILLPVTAQDIKAFDRREQGYDRIELRLSDIDRVPFLKEEHYQHEHHETFLNAKEQNARHAVKIWVYIQKENLPPTEDYPIVQSYVDTILRGCISVGGEEFAKEFIRSTKGWHRDDFSDSSDGSDSDFTDEIVWVDDRCTPVYQRGDPIYMQEHAKVLDSLLQKYSPKHLHSRKNLDGVRPKFKQ